MREFLNRIRLTFKGDNLVLLFVVICGFGNSSGTSLLHGLLIFEGKFLSYVVVEIGGIAVHVGKDLRLVSFTIKIEIGMLLSLITKSCSCLSIVPGPRGPFSHKIILILLGINFSVYTLTTSINFTTWRTIPENIIDANS